MKSKSHGMQVSSKKHLLFLQISTDYDEVTRVDDGVPFIATFGDWESFEVQYGIVIERQLYKVGDKSFAKVVLLFLAAFYVFNIDYGAISNTMYFIQKELMRIEGLNVPLKVK